MHCPEARRDPNREVAPTTRRRDVGTCYMDLRTDPSYRQVMRKYQFLMNVTNALDPAGLVLPLPVTSFAVGKLVGT